MKPIDPADTVTVRGVKLRRGPAREPCYKVVHLHTELRLSADLSDESMREKFHRDMNNETESLEIAAQCLVDFPEAPWELRLGLARQCWDESRHAALNYRRLLEVGGHKGEFPIANHEWGVVCMYDSLVARIAVQNRAFEGTALDGLQKGVPMFQQAGDPRTAEMIETILADEIAHVRMATGWLKEMAGADPRVLLQVGTAMAQLKQTIAALSPRPGEVSLNGLPMGDHDTEIRVSVENRRLAGFSEGEIAASIRREQAEVAAREAHGER